MIIIETTEKYLEFDFIPDVIKAELKYVWLELYAMVRNKLTIGFKFGKQNANGVIDSYTQTFCVVLDKTDEEIENYTFTQLHFDGKTILENSCKSIATFNYEV